MLSNFKQWFEAYDRRLHGDYGSCDAYRNPTKEELLKVIAEDIALQKAQGHGGDYSRGTARGWLTQNEDIYIWSSEALSHDQAARELLNDPYKKAVGFYISKEKGGHLELSISDFSTVVEDPRSVLKSNPNFCRMMEMPEPSIKIKPKLKRFPSLSDIPNYDDMPPPDDERWAKSPEDTRPPQGSWQKLPHGVLNAIMGRKKEPEHEPENLITPPRDLSWFFKQAWRRNAERHRQR